MHKHVLGRCPVCGDKLKVTRLECSKCGITIEGKFSLCKFSALSGEQKEFLECFIKCRGNIKEMEKELGVSYPTVKNKLEDLASALGFSKREETSEIENTHSSIDILNKIDNGELTVEDALKLIQSKD